MQQFNEFKKEEYQAFREDQEEKLEGNEQNFSKIFKKINYESQPFFRSFLTQIKDSASLHDQHHERFEKLKDLFEIQEKHQTSIALCVEAEIFPHIDDKIQQKVFQKVDSKVQKIHERYVTKSAFDYKYDELKTKIEENKEA